MDDEDAVGSIVVTAPGGMSVCCGQFVTVIGKVSASELIDDELDTDDADVCVAVSGAVV